MPEKIAQTSSDKSHFDGLNIIFAFILALVLLFLPSQNYYAFKYAYGQEKNVLSQLSLVSPAPIPKNFTQAPAPEISAQGALIVDVDSRITLFEKNPQLRELPASTTKIMTALVVLENYRQDQAVEVKSIVSEGQKMDLVLGEKITVENLLYGILVHSANDAALVLAEHDRGGVAGFVEKMNKKAVELNLTNTHFTNPIGFDDVDHYTSAEDLAKLSLYALHNTTFKKMVGIPQITVADTTFTYFHTLKNVNELLGKIPGVSGIKTGWTLLAGQSLVTRVQRDGHEVLIVLLSSSDRFSETEALVNWIFQNFQWEEVVIPSPLPQN